MLYLRLRSLLRAIRVHRQEISFDEATNGTGKIEDLLLKHRKKQEQVSRNVREVYVAMLVSAAENLPMAVLLVRRSVSVKFSDPPD